MALWCVAAIVVLAVFSQVGRMVLHQRKLAHKSQILGRLSQIALMIENYQAREGMPPPCFTTSLEGEKLLSWRALVLHFEEDGVDGLHLDEPWNSPANRMAAHHNLDKARWFSFQEVQRDPAPQILAVVGPNSLWHATTGRAKGKLNTAPEMVMLVGGITSQLHWMEPGDISEAELRHLLNAGEILYGRSTFGNYGMLTVRNNRLVIDVKSDDAF